MVGTSRKYKQIKVTDKNNPVNLKIIQLLEVKPDKKKEIANEVGVQLAYVHRVYSYYFKDQQDYDAMIEKEVNSIQEEEKVVVEEKEKEVINSQPLFDNTIVELRGRKTDKISDELKLAVLEYVETHTVRETCKKFQISDCSVYNFCNEFE